MKRIFILAGILAMLLGIFSCSREKSVELTSPNPAEFSQGSGQSYTDYQSGVVPKLSKSNIPQQQVAVQGNLGVYTNRASFNALAPDQTVVNFENANTPPNSFCAGRAFNSDAVNECFSPGAIPDGISFSTNGGELMILLTTGFLGLPSNVVGPNFFVADLDISFEPGEVNLVGMNLYNPFGPSILDVEVYGLNGVLLGIISGVATGTTIPTFFGVVALDQTPITRLRLVQQDSNGGELVDNVSYGLTGD